MKTRMRTVALRAGAAAALAVGLVAGVGAGPAFAADGPDVVVTPISLHIAKGVKKAKAKPFQVELRNRGNATAADVSVKVELGDLDGVGWVRPDGCEKAGKAVYTCAIGDIPAGQDVVIGIPLFSVGAKVGNAGFFRVTAPVAGDTNPDDNTVDADIKVERKSYDLTVWAQDVYAEVVADGDEVGEETRTPVPPGGTAPLDSAIFNHGSRKVVGVGYAVALPKGASFAAVPENCFVDENLDEGINGVICEDDELVLKPGEVFLPVIAVKVADDATAGVLEDGLIQASAIDEGTGDDDSDAARVATETQRKAIVDDADPIDNQARFEVFVGDAPTEEPTTPGEPGEGGGGGLPVTGPAAGIIGGVGGAVILAGLALFFFARRRRIVTVTPDA